MEDEKEDAVTVFLRSLFGYYNISVRAEMLRQAIRSESQLSKRQAEWVRRTCDENVPQTQPGEEVPKEHTHPEGWCCINCPQDEPPLPIEQLEALQGPEPERVEGKVLRKGWYHVFQDQKSGLYPADKGGEFAVYIKVIECAPPADEEQLGPRD